MKRRGFLGGLLGVGVAAPTAVLAAGLAKDDQPNIGFMYRCVCPNRACGVKLAQYIALSGPLNVGNQCPHCLHVLDLSGLSDQIADFMRENSVWNGYTRRIA